MSEQSAESDHNRYHVGAWHEYGGSIDCWCAGTVFPCCESDRSDGHEPWCEGHPPASIPTVPTAAQAGGIHLTTEERASLLACPRCGGAAHSHTHMSRGASGTCDLDVMGTRGAAVEHILQARMADAWEAGFTKAARLIAGLDSEPWPPTPNPYRSEDDDG